MTISNPGDYILYIYQIEDYHLDTHLFVNQ